MTQTGGGGPSDQVSSTKVVNRLPSIIHNTRTISPSKINLAEATSLMKLARIRIMPSPTPWPRTNIDKFLPVPIWSTDAPSGNHESEKNIATINPRTIAIWRTPQIRRMFAMPM
tara:strand:- start:87 stop:428 length:342 start_codon:yes stop_codon:yes gene_type:complete